MVDIHTHYDVEVLEQPELVESLRHGVTTILIGSCSLSTVHVDPTTAGDLFGRVEAIPRRHVIESLERDEDLELGAGVRRRARGAAARARTWPPSSATPTSAPREMGLDRATRKDVRPTEPSSTTMQANLEEALDAGFVGMSAQELMFDKLDGDICRSRTLPSTYPTGRNVAGSTRCCASAAGCCRAGPDISR